MLLLSLQFGTFWDPWLLLLLALDAQEKLVKGDECNPKISINEQRLLDFTFLFKLDRINVKQRRTSNKNVKFEMGTILVLTNDFDQKTGFESEPCFVGTAWVLSLTPLKKRPKRVISHTLCQVNSDDLRPASQAISARRQTSKQENFGFENI